jgi:hypothetical protein
MSFFSDLFGKKAIKMFCTYKKNAVTIEKGNPYQAGGPKSTFICDVSRTEQPGCDEGNCMYNIGVAKLIHTTSKMAGLPTEKMDFSDYRQVGKQLSGMTDHLTEIK